LFTSNLLEKAFHNFYSISEILNPDDRRMEIFCQGKMKISIPQVQCDYIVKEKEIAFNQEAL